VVTLDGDEAGRIHRAKLAEYLEGKGVKTRTYELPEGFDIADRLVEKYAKAGCGCRQCQQMRSRAA